MALPNFPIRTRLIPYDDLGIQEVSPNLLSLGSDVDIILAALMAMGKNGSQMLQSNKYGKLLTASTGVSSYADVGERIIFGDYHLTDTSPDTPKIDFSRHLYYMLMLTITNNTDANNAMNILTFVSDSLNNDYNVNNLGSITGNGSILSFLGFTPGVFIPTDNMHMEISGFHPANSLNLHVEAYAI